MRYTLASMFSKDQFTIDGDGGSPLFEVRRIHGLDGNSLSLRDPAGSELASIRPRTGPTRFEVTVGSLHPITVRDKGRFGRKYCIDTPAGEMSATVGDFSPGPYELLSSEMVRANVSREGRLKKDLVIDLADGQDMISLIAIVLAIETLRDDRYRLSRVFLTSVWFSRWLTDQDRKTPSLSYAMLVTARAQAANGQASRAIRGTGRPDYEQRRLAHFQRMSRPS